MISILASSSALKTEAIRASEILVYFYRASPLLALQTCARLGLLYGPPQALAVL
jgi:hypothetical protein